MRLKAPERKRLTIYLSPVSLQRVTEFVEKRNQGPGHHTLSSVIDEMCWALNGDQAKKKRGRPPKHTE